MMPRARPARLPRRDGAVHLRAALDERTRRPRAAACTPASAGMALADRSPPGSQPEVVHHGWIVVAIVAGVRGRRAARRACRSPPCRSGPRSRTPSAAWPPAWSARPSTTSGSPRGPRTSRRSGWSRSSLEIILGFLTFTGSLMAAGKLQEVKWIPQRPVTYPRPERRQHRPAARWPSVLGVAAGAASRPRPGRRSAFPVVIVRCRSLFGVLLIIPIGGADMPTVISILNSYAGLSAVAMGFVLDNKLLITAGALDGSSGLILSIIMCKAMNRSFTNVLFGAFGQVQQPRRGGEQKAYKAETVEGAAQILEQASLVVIIPGYGMAVAQAQHKVRELYDQLTKRGITVKFAIHPVAGRMPGPHERAAGRGRHSVHRPGRDGRDQPRHAAVRRGAGDRRQRRREPGGAPRQDAARSTACRSSTPTRRARVFAIKRSKNPGFAGIDNELYFARQDLHALRRRQGRRRRRWSSSSRGPAAGTDPCRPPEPRLCRRL